MREQGRAAPYVIPGLWINRQLVPPFPAPADDEQKRIPGASGASSLATTELPPSCPAGMHGGNAEPSLLCLSGQETPGSCTAATCSYKPTSGTFPAPANNAEKLIHSLVPSVLVGNKEVHEAGRKWEQE